MSKKIFLILQKMIKYKVNCIIRFYWYTKNETIPLERDTTFETNWVLLMS